MFVTWKLWNALHAPQLRHPILQEAKEYKKPKKPLVRLWTWLFLGIILLVAIFLFLFPIPTLLTILALAFAIPALMFLFNSSVLGLYWVGEIAETIAREQRQGRFELLSLTPEGAVGVIWLLALGVIHRQNWLDTAYGILKKAALSILVLLAASSITLLWGAFSAEISPERESQIRILREVIMIGFFVLALWLDHIQSLVLALMMGIFLPSYMREEGFLRLSACLLYFGLQALIYLLILTPQLILLAKCVLMERSAAP